MGFIGGGAGGGGAVDSVNGATGAVELDAADVGAQPVDSDLTAIAALTTTSFGRELLALADAAGLLTEVGASSETTRSTSGKGYVNHGATAGTARPSGYASVEWSGSVEPENALDGDTWIDTA